MKKIILIFSLLVSFTKIFSQINDNCINAIPLCSTPSFTFNANSGPGSIVDFSVTSTVSNPSINPNPPNSGCLHAGELNPQWLLITIGNAGLLEFVFGASTSSHPQVGCYDWAMWPYSPTTCADIFNNTLAPIRCNWNGTCGGGTGIASASNMAVFNGNSSDFQPPLQVNACQQFVICISNYSGVNTLVSFQSLGTASLSCSPNCNPNYAMCYGSSATIVPVNFAALSNPTFVIQPQNISNTTGSFVVSPTVTTTYTTLITGINSVNSVQTLTASSTVTVNAMPIVAPTVTNSSCTSTLNAVNLNLTFIPSASPPSYTVNWSPIPNGITNSSQTSFTGGISPGAYTATITTATGCSTITSFTVNPVPTPVSIVVNPLGSTHSITCISNVTLTAMNPAYNYTWSSIVAVFAGSVAVFTPTMIGNYTLTAVDPNSGCVGTQTFIIGQNTITPVSTITPIMQNITCNANSIITITATASPSVNITHEISSPQGGTFSAQSYSTIYTPGGVGVFTACAVNNINGCSSCTHFTVTSNLGFPTYNIISPDNFTLGCNSKSVAVVNIINGNTSSPSGGPVSYTIIGPPTSPITPTGSLSGNSSYTINVPGTWTVITKDNTSFCETRTPISILTNTLGPDLITSVPRTILDCYVPRTTLKGSSGTPNVNYLWSFAGSPGTLQGDTISILSLSASPTTSVIGNYTLTITDNSSTCKSDTVIIMRQNLYPPVGLISGGTGSISCKTATIVLTNQSKTGIPPATGFPYQLPAIGYIWEGPSPQETQQLQTTYVGATPGIYTLTVKDLNNGCLSTATTVIGENRVYPEVNKPIAPEPFTLDCGSLSRTITPTITGPTAGYTYSWTAPAAATISPPPYTATLTVNKVGSYRVMITNTLNGCGSIGELTVVNGTLNADFEVQPITGVAPLPVTFFNNSTSSLGSSSITVSWNFGNGTSTLTNANNLSTSTTFSLPGTYKVTMYATKGTCLDTAIKYIQVEIPSVMEIPNVFTPNGDGANDLFFLKATNLEEINVTIFDRWGHVVYSLISTSGNIAWDGKNQSGKEVAEGTYFYVIKGKGKDAQTFEKKGTVSLYR